MSDADKWTVSEDDFGAAKSAEYDKWAGVVGVRMDSDEVKMAGLVALAERIKARVDPELKAAAGLLKDVRELAVGANGEALREAIKRNYPSSDFFGEKS